MNDFIQLFGHQLPTFPILLGQSILNGEDGILFDQLGIVVDHLFGTQFTVFGLELIFTLAVELAGGRIQGQPHVFAWLVASGFDGFEDQGQGLFIGAQIGREPAFIAHGRIQAFALKYFFQCMKGFGAHLNGLADRFGTKGNYHKFLNIQVVGGMCAAIDDVHHGNRQHPGIDAAKVAVKGQAESHGGRPGRGHGDPQDGIGPHFGFVGRAVQLDHGAIQRHLIGCIHPHNCFGDGRINILNGRCDPFAAITFGSRIAQFKSLPGTRGGPRRYGCATGSAAGQHNIHLNSGVAP